MDSSTDRTHLAKVIFLTTRVSEVLQPLSNKILTRLTIVKIQWWTGLMLEMVSAVKGVEPLKNRSRKGQMHLNSRRTLNGNRLKWKLAGQFSSLKRHLSSKNVILMYQMLTMFKAIVMMKMITVKDQESCLGARVVAITCFLTTKRERFVLMSLTLRITWTQSKMKMSSNKKSRWPINWMSIVLAT